MKSIPVYIIDGILESGKTTFIKSTIASDDFFKKGRTLVLSGEEGIVEYDNSFCEHYNTVVKYFEDQDEFTVSNLMKAVEEEKPNRIVIELNGMWDLTKIEFPANFKIYQFIDFINFETFQIYFANMKQKMLDIVKQSDVVVFINVKGELEKLKPYASSFKLSNKNAQFMEMDEKGQLQDAFEFDPADLPYDVNADIIKIKNEDYGTWYIDTFDHKNLYQDKVVEMTAMVVLSNTLPKGTFIAGRLAMTCCSNDVQLYGHLCVNNSKKKLKDRSWVHIIATVRYEWSEQYQEEECVLYPVSIEPTEPLENPVLDLTK